MLRRQPFGFVLELLELLSTRKNLRGYPKKVLRCIAAFKDTSAFLINVNDLILNKEKHTHSEIYVYLELAALRSYINYKETGNLRLPTYYMGGKYDLKDLRFNTLLIVTEDEIIFKYEELKNG